uniref:RNA-binding protein Musashi homolog 2-like n=1 Tax=Sinocyclocheilus grahami TaxID=75366 RepID=A0A672NAY4_SINGR
MEADASQVTSGSPNDSQHDPGLRDYFSKFGEIRECMVMRDPTTKRSRGFGFITFADVSSVDKVLAQPHHELDSKTIDPKVAFPRRAQPKMVTRTKKIFVGGLSASTVVEDVKQYFEQFGKVRPEHYSLLIFQFHRALNFARSIYFHHIANLVKQLFCHLAFLFVCPQVECKKAQPKEVMFPPGTRGRARSLPYTMDAFMLGMGMLSEALVNHFLLSSGFPATAYGPVAAAAVAAARGSGFPDYGFYSGPSDQRGAPCSFADYASLGPHTGQMLQSEHVTPTCNSPSQHHPSPDHFKSSGANPPRPGGFPGANSPGPVADLYGPSSQDSAVGNYISAASPQPGSGFNHSIAVSRFLNQMKHIF